jgi:hypothetical protein
MLLRCLRIAAKAVIMTRSTVSTINRGEAVRPGNVPDDRATSGSETLP